MVTEVQTGLSVLDSLSQVQTQILHGSLIGGSFTPGMITNTFLITFFIDIAGHTSKACPCLSVVLKEGAEVIHMRNEFLQKPFTGQDKF